MLSQPAPCGEEAHRQLIAHAARAQGIATVRDLSTYYFTNVKTTATRVQELVDAGVLARIAVEGWKDPAFAPVDVKPARPRRLHATLLSPFDSLIWDRARTLRLFDFEYRIEVYTPEPTRKYGYYVLPLLLGDALVGRVDLKADRKASTLQVRGAYVEGGADVEGSLRDHGRTGTTGARRPGSDSTPSRWLVRGNLAAAPRPGARLSDDEISRRPGRGGTG